MTGKTNKGEGGKFPPRLDTGDFALVVSDKKMKGSGLSRGDEVLIGTMKPLPEKRSDPYLQRLYAVCLKIENDLPLVPKDDNDYKAIMVDPRNLEKLSEERANTIAGAMAAR